MKNASIVLLVLLLLGCSKEVVWNGEAHRCQQVNSPHEFVPNAQCGR